MAPSGTSTGEKVNTRRPLTNAMVHASPTENIPNWNNATAQNSRTHSVRIPNHSSDNNAAIVREMRGSGFTVPSRAALRGQTGILRDGLRLVSANNRAAVALR